MAYTKYSLTPANNNAAPPDGAPEGMLPSAVNDTMRDMMAQIRDVGDGIRGGTYTMTAPVITGGSINGTTIGATTASTGAFSTLAYTGTLTGGTGIVNLGSGQFYKDASGNVGIGTSSPAGFKLAINNGAVGDIVNITDGVAQTLRIKTGTGFVALDNPSSGALAFQVSGTERMRVNSGAPILCLAGGNTSATGTGIAFPATQSASSDANTLDDYEEGTWTPTITMASGTSTGSSGEATYVKIGRQVTVTVSLAVGTISAGGEINTINGLPFTVRAGNDQAVGLSRENANTGFGWELRANTTDTSILIRKVADNSAVITTGMQFIGTVTYFV